MGSLPWLESQQEMGLASYSGNQKVTVSDPQQPNLSMGWPPLGQNGAPALPLKQKTQTSRDILNLLILVAWWQWHSSASLFTGESVCLQGTTEPCGIRAAPISGRDISKLRLSLPSKTPSKWHDNISYFRRDLTKVNRSVCLSIAM